MTWRCCANWSAVGRKLVEGRARHPRIGRADGADRSGRGRALCGGRRRGRPAARRRASRVATRTALGMIEQALNSGGHVSGKTTGLTSDQREDRRPARFRPHHPRRAPGHGQDLARHQHRLQRRRPPAPRHAPTASPRQVGRRGGRLLQPGNERRPARHAYPRRAVGDQLARCCAWARSAARTSSSCRYASQRLAELPLYIDDTPALTIAALRTRARRLKRRHDIGLIVVDYLQLLQGIGPRQRQPGQRDFRDQPRPQDAGQGARACR